MKKILILLIALFTSGIINAQSETQALEIRNRMKNSIPNNLPNLFNNVKICLDPGHGGHNDGNDRYIYWLDRYIGVNDYGLAYWESNGNFYTAFYMREVLEKLGALVKLTREMNDNDIVLSGTSYGNGGEIGSSDPKLSYRENISNTFGAKYFQSIHTNATGAVGGDATPNTSNYVRAYIPNSNSSIQTAVSIKLANKNSEMNYSYDTQAQVHEFSVTNNVYAYAVLTEGGFHTHIAEGRRLRSPLYLQAQAMSWVKGYIEQEGKTSLITWGEIGGITYSDDASEYTAGETARGYELGLGLNQVKVTLDKGTANESFVVVDQDELDANYNEGEYVSGGNHITKNGGYNGFYYFNFVSPGSHTLTFERAGIATKIQTVTVTAGEHLRNDVKLTVIGNPATAPTLTLISPNGIDGVFAQWTPTYTASDLVGYKLYYSTDDTQTVWKLAADESTINATATSISIASKSNFIETPNNTPKHYKIVAITSVDGTTITGEESNILSKFSGSIDADILIVEGFDRRDGSYTTSGNFITKYINAIAGAKDVNISSTLNEYIISGEVNLMDFDAVVWVLGDESTDESTFAWNERSVVDDYLDAGGNLFVSGSEIGWDLSYKGDVNDKAFYNNYLKANYVADGSARTIANGVTTTILDGVSIAPNYTYTAGYADEISAANGSTLVMKYSNGSGAGVYYKGTFGTGTKEGSVMHLSFPLEASSTADMTLVLTKFINGFSINIPATFAPIANNDNDTTFENQGTEIDVLANDTDVDNDIDASTLAIVSNPLNGTVVIANNKVTYTPNTNYVGNDSFTYTVSDSQAKVSNTATVDINVQACELTATSTDTYYVRYVLFNDIDNNQVFINQSVADGGYDDNTSKIISVTSGKEYRALLRGKYGIDNTVNPSYWKMWIDYNNDGKFDGTNEEIISKEGDAYVFNNFVIDANVAIGNYTLRIATSSQPITSACGDIVAGEIEDYTLQINPEGLIATSDADHYISYFKVYESANTSNVIVNNDEAAGNINNGGYGDYKNITLNLDKEEVYKLNIGLKYGVTTPRNFKAWIDYNNDGNFDGANEEIYATVSPVTGWFAGEFVIPADISIGTYTLRVAMNASTIDNTINATGIINPGEVEEYTVEISEKVVTASYSPTAVGQQKGLNSQYEWISYVKIGSESHSSGNDNGYADYSGTTIFHMSPNTVYSLNLNPGYSGTAYNENWKIWVDLNQDGDFADAGEEIYAIPSVTSGWITGSLSLPDGTLPGNYRMRVAMNGSSSNYTLTPGVDFTYGEVQDYMVNVEYSFGKTLDIDESSIVEVSAYPNPVIDVLNIKINSDAGKITIYNVNGILMHEEEISNNTTKINSSNWEAGMYIIVIKHNTGREIVKVMKK